MAEDLPVVSGETVTETQVNSKHVLSPSEIGEGIATACRAVTILVNNDSHSNTATSLMDTTTNMSIHMSATT